MNRRRWIISFTLALALLVSGVMTAGCTTGAPPKLFLEEVSAQKAYAMIQENSDNPDFVIIDVRTPEEYDEGHIEGALNINYQSENFGEDIAELGREKTYLIHCRSGVRSAGAVSVMLKLKFQKIYHMNGGILEWIEEDLPLVE